MKRNTAVPRHTALRALEVSEDGEEDPNAAPGILDAAIRAFDERGYEQSSISYIADLAGISKSLVLYYFPSKPVLGAAVIDMAYPGGVFMGSPRGKADPLDAIVWSAEHIATNVVHNPLARVALTLVDNESVASRWAPSKYGGWLVRLTDYLDEAQASRRIASHIDTGTQAKYLLSGIVGTIALDLATGARLCLVQDAVQITRDRLQQITRHP